jgi:polysaccharide biosynthesis protein PslH
LAAVEDVYLMVVHPPSMLLGPLDEEMEALCQKCQSLYLVEPQAEEQKAVQGTQMQITLSAMPSLSVTQKTLAAQIKHFYDEEKLEHLFVFRMESYFLLQGSLDQYPSRALDMDESCFQRSQNITLLKARNGEEESAERRRANKVISFLERQMVSRFPKVFVSSAKEMLRARDLSRETLFHVLPNIFPTRTPSFSSPAEKPREILFVGTLSYYPNEDAARYFAEEIFPLIQKREGDGILFRIVGFGGSTALEALEKNPGVKWMGYQENLDSFYAAASVVVVPLRAGTGTRLKIQEAFTQKRPVVSTAIGAEGMAVTDGENILLADEPEHFAAACLKILDQPELAARLIQGGLKLHGELYSLACLIKSYRDREV